MAATKTHRRWSAIDKCPNASQLLALRRQTLRHTRRRPVRDRVAYLVSLAQGKHVLDVGAADHVVDDTNRGTWLHGRVASVAAKCVGIDTAAEEVTKLQAAGFDVRLANITDPGFPNSLREQFDLILCGEVIEHLDAPGALFDTARQLLVPGGRLVLSSPNPFSIWTFLRHATGRPNENVDHVLFAFPGGIMELAERHGLRLTAWRGTLIAGVTTKHRIAFSLQHLASWIVTPEVLCTTLLYECVKE